MPRTLSGLGRRLAVAVLLGCGVVLLVGTGAPAAAQEGPRVAAPSGVVLVGDLPVPGATVTVSRPGRRLEAVTDAGGRYAFLDLSEDVWTLEVRMTGFAPAGGDLQIATGAAPVTWRLELLAADRVAAAEASGADRTEVEGVVGLGGAGADGADAAASPFHPAGPDADAGARPFDPAAAAADAAARPFGAAEGGDTSSASPLGADPEDAEDTLLVTGSVSNASTTPFGQPRAFGNNRPAGRRVYSGAVSLGGGDSALDARPYPFAGGRPEKPDYTDVDVGATFGGPVRLPGVGAPGFLLLSVEQTANSRARTESALVPTLRERAGDFSATRDAAGRLVRLTDPATGRPFEGAALPGGRISPQAAALLAHYPLPNLDAGGRYNYQTAVVQAERRRRLDARYSSFTVRNSVSGAFAWGRTTTDRTSLFGFSDAEAAGDLDARMEWSHTVPHLLWLRARYRFTRAAFEVRPHFANRVDVAGEAGIAGGARDPAQWGPPGLVFSNGLAGLTDAPAARRRDRTHAWSAEVGLFSRNRHEIRFGGGVAAQALDLDQPANPRGSFTFTGAASGSPFADFLLGLPQTATVGFGHAATNLRAPSVHAYITDDWRLRGRLTLTLGVRWEYEAPMTELADRLANLDVASGFRAAAPVVAGDPLGPLTGRRYGRGLLRPDRLGVQPRLGLAWRPVEGSSLVVRAGYGVYRNAGPYPSLAMLLAQQPPLATTLSVERGPSRPLSLAGGLVGAPGAFRSTFAVDPDFRVGLAHQWQVSVTRDLPAALVLTATYSGTAGRRLLRQTLPNTAPPGAPNPCPDCPVGFVYARSDGSSLRHAGQVALRRRLRNGLTARVEYTLARAVDDGVAFDGATLSGAAIAQDWRNPDADWGPSRFDQRHRVTAEVEYASGVGLGGGALWGGWTGALLRGWTFSAQLTAGSGLPLTPLYLAAVPGTGFTGILRADLTGASAGAAPDGLYLNPAAYAVPAPGEWGAVGRNSVSGPAQFDLGAGVGRGFAWGDRMTLDWRLEASNVLNRVTWAAVSTTVGSPQFGLPTLAYPMRTLRTSLRLGF